jgi:hypothetical protein
VPEKTGASFMVLVLYGTLKQHRQIAGTSSQAFCTASCLKKQMGTTGKLVGMVIIKKIWTIRSQVLTL